MNKHSFLSAKNVLTKPLCDTLKASPKRIVFTEGEDVRVLKAADALVEEELIAPILLGNRKRITKLAKKEGISLEWIKIIDPVKADDLELFLKLLQRVEKYRGRVIANPHEMVTNPLNFGAMMVQYGQADGIVAGNTTPSAAVFRSVVNFIKPMADVPSIFCVSLIFEQHLKDLGSDGVLLLADCGITPDPTVEELTSFAIETGKLASQITDRPSNVAFLSHSTLGSTVTASSLKMSAATALTRNKIKSRSLAIKVVGELQADVALDPSAAEVKVPDGISCPADAVIFPNLDSANISLMFLKHVAQNKFYGQLIMGLTKPAAQVPMTTTVETLIGTAVLVGVESVKARELHFDWD